jgi:hypothetical protein
MTPTSAVPPPPLATTTPTARDRLSVHRRQLVELPRARCPRSHRIPRRGAPMDSRFRRGGRLRWLVPDRGSIGGSPSTSARRRDRDTVRRSMPSSAASSFTVRPDR